MFCLLNYIIWSFKVKFILKILTLSICLYLPQQLAQDLAKGGAQQKLIKQCESVEHLWVPHIFLRLC